MTEHPYEKEGGWGGERWALDMEDDDAPCESWGCCHACEICDRYCRFNAWKSRVAFESEPQ